MSDEYYEDLKKRLDSTIAWYWENEPYVTTRSLLAKARRAIEALQAEAAHLRYRLVEPQGEILDELEKWATDRSTAKCGRFEWKDCWNEVLAWIEKWRKVLEGQPLPEPVCVVRLPLPKVCTVCLFVQKGTPDGNGCFGYRCVHKECKPPVENGYAWVSNVGRAPVVGKPPEWCPLRNCVEK